MKKAITKALQTITAAVLSVAFVGAAASAQTPGTSTTCDGNFTITNTGNNSTQTIDCEEESNVTVVCTNTGAVINYTDQNGNSGSATVTGNGTGGSAVSGSVTNSNSSTTDLTFECAVGSSETPSQNVSPSPSVTPTTTTKPAALPYTAANSTAAIVATSLIAAAAVVVGSRIAVAAYRRFSAHK